jgi:importin-9
MATLEDQIIDLLGATLSNLETPRKAAELQLQSMYPTPGFAMALASVGSHSGVLLNIRQAALLFLRQFVQAAWSSEFDEFKGAVLVSDEDKARLRSILLDLALNCPERKLKKAASYVVSKIGSSDFPEEWADLLPTVLQVVQTGNEDQVNGALKVLVDLIDDSFNEEQFFGVARELVGSVYRVATNDSIKPTTRALAISVFRACFDILEMILEEYKSQVKSFADETLSTWIPFLIKILESKLPDPPTIQEENQKSQAAETYRGLVAFKLQVVKVFHS